MLLQQLKEKEETVQNLEQRFENAEFMIVCLIPSTLFIHE